MGEEYRPFEFKHWPTEHKVITQWFGVNPQNYLKFGLPGHEGIDFMAPHGSKIYAVASGKVIQVNPDNGPYGINVRVRHENGYITIYAHLMEAHVKVGDMVDPGQVIALADSTGNSTGDHLHLTLRHEGETLGKYPNNIIDPTEYVKALLAG